MVPQKAVLFAGSIRENMQWGKKDAGDEDIYKALDIAQAKEIVEKKEGGLDFEVEQGGRNLSGGQRQRLTIARALLRDPSILILDDSASALDFATDAALRAALRTLRGTTTVFLVSQRTMSLRSADRILVLDDGQLVGSGTHEELLKTCRVYQEIHYSQFPEERPEGWQDTLEPGAGFRCERRPGGMRHFSPKRNTTLRKIFQYIRAHRVYLVLSILFAAITAVLTLYVPILFGDAIDGIIRKGPGGFRLNWFAC